VTRLSTSAEAIRKTKVQSVYCIQLQMGARMRPLGHDRGIKPPRENRTTMESACISSWEEFSKIAEQTDVGGFDSPCYAFRGQSDAAWGLQPSLLRCLGAHMPPKDALELEKAAVAQFKSRAHLYLPPNVFATTTDTVSWWTLMQHHGVPTRLLDWTASIYVAAYFAVHGSAKMDGAVWIVHTNALHDWMDSNHGESQIPKREDAIAELFLVADPPSIVTFVARDNGSDRMVAQRGLFSVCCRVLADHGSIFDGAFSEPADKLLYGKVVIPAALKPQFSRRLRAMNVAASALFPGIDGLGKSVAEFLQFHGYRCGPP
jgi:hypothetical protein